MTGYQRVVEALFREMRGRDLLEWIAEERDDGQSWQAIAAHLEHMTGGAVRVTGQALVNWSRKQAAA